MSQQDFQAVLMQIQPDLKENIELIEIIFPLWRDQDTLLPLELFLIKQIGIKQASISTFIEKLTAQKQFHSKKLIKWWLNCFILTEFGLNATEKVKINKLTQPIFNDKESLKRQIQEIYKELAGELNEQEVNSVLEKIHKDPIFYKLKYCLNDDPSHFQEQKVLENQILSKDLSENKELYEEFQDLKKDLEYFPKDSIQYQIQFALIEIQNYLINANKQKRKIIFEKPTNLEKMRLKITERSEQIDNHFAKLINGEKILENLVGLKKRVTPINLLELERLIEKTQSAQQKIKGKDVVMFIGTSGAGKSTSILRFLGYKLAKTILSNQLVTLMPEQKLREEHLPLKTSPLTKSCTRYIYATEALKEMYPPGTSKSQMNVFLCDSPGFGDTAGFEVDIANGIGMINAIHECNSLRVVVLISEKQLGDKCSGLIEIGKIVCNLFVGDLSKYRSGIKIFFNKFFIKEERNQVKIKITDMIEESLNQGDKANQKLIAFLELVRAESTKMTNFLDVFSTDYQELFHNLLDKEAIGNLENSIRYNFSQETTKQLISQSQDFKIKCLDSYRESKYEIAEFYLRMLQKMNKIIRLTQVEQAFQIASEFIQKDCQTILINIEKKLKLQILTNTAHDSVYLETKNMIQKLKTVDSLKHLNEIIGIPSFARVNSIIQQCKQSVILGFSQKNISQNELKGALQFAKHFAVDIEKSIKEIVKGRYDAICSQLKQFTIKQKYSQMFQSMITFSNQFKLIQCIHPQLIKSEELLRVHLTILQANIDKYFMFFIEVQNSTFIVPETDIIQVNKFLNNISLIQSFNIQEKGFTELKQKKKDVVTTFVDKIRQKLKMINGLISDEREEKILENFNLLKTLKPTKENIERLKNIIEVEEYVKIQIKNSDQRLEQAIKRNHLIVKQTITQLRKQNVQGIEKNLVILKRAIDVLNRFSEIIILEEGIGNLIDSLSDEFLKYLQLQKSKIEKFRSEMNLSVIKKNTIQKIFQKFLKIGLFKRMATVLSKTADIVQIVQIIETLLNQFLFKPCIDIKIKHCLPLQQKQYTKIIFSLELFDKYAFFCEEIEEYSDVNVSSYEKIQIYNKEIIELLQRPFTQIKDALKNILEESVVKSQNSESESIRNTAKILKLLKKKPNFNNYLDKFDLLHVDFQANRLCQYLQDRKVDLDRQFKENKESSDLLMHILRKCSEYEKTQEELKGCVDVSIGFKELYSQIDKTLNQSLQDQNQIIAKELSKQVKAIDFKFIAKVYRQYSQSNANIGKKNKIILKLQDKQNNLIDKITKFMKDIRWTQKIGDFQELQNIFQTMDNANYLKNQLNKFYNQKQQDKILITVEILKNAGKTLVVIFKTKYEGAKISILNYKVDQATQNIKEFQLIERIIVDINLSDGADFKELMDNYKIQLIKFINTGYQKQIVVEKYSGNISGLFSQFLQCINDQIKQKYEKSDSDKFVIDQNLNKYYEGFKNNDKNSINHKKKEDIQIKIREKFESQFDRLKKQGKSSELKKNQIINILYQYMAFIPANLRKQLKNQLAIKSEEIQKANLESLKKQIEDLYENPTYLISFIKIINNHAAKKNEILQRRYIQELSHYLSHKFQKNKEVNNALSHLEAVYWRNYSQISQITKETNVLLVIVDKYKQNISNLKVIIEDKIYHIFQELKPSARIFEKQESIASNILTVCIKRVEIIFFIFEKIRNQKQNYGQELHREIIEKIFAFIKEIIADYKTKSTSSNYLEILYSEKQTETTLNIYAANIGFVGPIFEAVKTKLISIQSQQQVKDKKISTFLEEMNESINYQIILKELKLKINQMRHYIENFIFQSSENKNSTVKQLEKQFQKLNKHLLRLTFLKNTFENFICKENVQQFYSLEKMKEDLNLKIINLQKDCQIQLKQCFEEDGKFSTKINLFLQTLNILKNKNYRFILEKDRDNILREFQKKIKESYEFIGTKINKELDSLKKTVGTLKKQKQKITNDKKRQYGQCQKQLNTQMIKKIEIIKQNFTQSSSGQTEAKKKEQLENARDTQIKSIKTENRVILGEQRKKISERYIKKEEVFNLKTGQFVKRITNYIIIFKRITLDINFDKDCYEKMLDKFFVRILKQTNKLIVKLFIKELDSRQNDYNSIAQTILNDHNIFKNHALNRFTEITKKLKINDIADQIIKLEFNGKNKLSKIQFEKMLSAYKEYETEYDDQLEKYGNAANEQSINRLITQAKDYGSKLSSQFYNKDQNKQVSTKKVVLLAKIFALWAILKSEKDEEQDGGEVHFIMNPHPAQVATLILLLGLNKNNSALQLIDNRLAQVGTGEGKSVILAGLSCYLALVGFKVRCACYSSYLSIRDQESFSDLFLRLNISENIKYGTFNQLCQDILNSDGKTNLKESVKLMMLQQPAGFLERIKKSFGFNALKFQRAESSKKTILIIDQVDVFFDQNFYGNSYCPAISLTGPEVDDILGCVWKAVSAKKDLQVKQIYEKPQYRALIAKYPTLQKILLNQMHDMVSGALNYQHEYLIINQKILYKDNDSISPNISYGYKTVFANFFEFERNAINSINFKNQLKITLAFAQFSYALLPKYFSAILGVTGTLEVMPHNKKNQLEARYNVKEQYLIPSVYGDVLERRSINYEIVKQSVNYYDVLVKKINSVPNNRPIIIFFKTASDINNFFISQQYRNLQQRTVTLTEEHDPATRDNRIKRATNENQITIMTSSFGRGTDFLLLNKQIIANGGLHVIHSYLSLEQSEEIQVKGRVARQGNKGSYDCVLHETCLQELELKYHENMNISDTLFKARQIRDDKLSNTILMNLRNADLRHQRVIEVFCQKNLKQDDLIEYIYSLNSVPIIQKINVKTVIGIDATGSMDQALKRTCSIIGQAFERTYKILSQQKIRGTFQIMISAYRNYSSGSTEILESTTFESTPSYVKDFLQRVSPRGGQGNEAVQIFLQYVNKLDKLDQILLIGDAPPNKPNEIEFSRKKYFGDAYWDSHGFFKTTVDQQINIIQQKNIPIHTFYIKDAKSSFQQISQKTKGQCSQFNLKKATASQDLTRFIVEHILEIIGNQDHQGKGVQLINRYKKMFG